MPERERWAIITIMVWHTEQQRDGTEVPVALLEAVAYRINNGYAQLSGIHAQMREILEQLARIASENPWQIRGFLEEINAELAGVKYPGRLALDIKLGLRLIPTQE